MIEHWWHSGSSPLGAVLRITSCELISSRELRWGVFPLNNIAFWHPSQNTRADQEGNVNQLDWLGLYLFQDWPLAHADLEPQLSGLSEWSVLEQAEWFSGPSFFSGFLSTEGTSYFRPYFILVGWLLGVPRPRLPGFKYGTFVKYGRALDCPWLLVARFLRVTSSHKWPFLATLL